MPECSRIHAFDSQQCSPKAEIGPIQKQHRKANVKGLTAVHLMGVPLSWPPFPGVCLERLKSRTPQSERRLWKRFNNAWSKMTKYHELIDKSHQIYAAATFLNPTQRRDFQTIPGLASSSPGLRSCWLIAEIFGNEITPTLSYKRRLESVTSLPVNQHSPHAGPGGLRQLSLTHHRCTKGAKIRT
jgi:hypothetical protein